MILSFLPPYHYIRTTTGDYRGQSDINKGHHSILAYHVHERNVDASNCCLFGTLFVTLLYQCLILLHCVALQVNMAQWIFCRVKSENLANLQWNGLIGFIRV
jgi:hypothetical protein